jgi:hypothetical protein
MNRAHRAAALAALRRFRSADRLTSTHSNVDDSLGAIVKGWVRSLAPLKLDRSFIMTSLDDPNTMPRLQLSMDACLFLRAHR